MLPSRRILILPITAALLDAGLTVVGQPSGFLAGEATAINELNPLAYWLMSISPFAFFIGVMAWGAIVGAAVIFLPAPAARIASIIVLTAHFVGASSWLVRYPGGPLYVSVLWLIAIYWVYPIYKRSEHLSPRSYTA